MKIIVTHSAPDMDAITSVWLIKRFLPDWADAEVKFVPAGQRYKNQEFKSSESDPIEHYGDDEVLHVDTGLGPLDHHQTSDDQVCGASLTWEYVQTHNHAQLEKPERREAIFRIVAYAVQLDHFKDAFWENPTADYHDMSIDGIIDGIKLLRPDDDTYLVNFAMECLDALLHTMENKIWAEQEIKENGQEFETRWGKGIGFQTINDDVIKLSQKMGYRIVVRRDPRKGYVRIKARPYQRLASSDQGSAVSNQQSEKENVDLTLVYEQLKKIDPEATWFLHVSKKMLLNGTPKNPKMKPTTLSLQKIIEILEKV